MSDKKYNSIPKHYSRNKNACYDCVFGDDCNAPTDLKTKCEQEDVYYCELKEFTAEDLKSCWTYFEDYFVDVLNGKYSLEEAIEDLRGLIGTKWDDRTKETTDLIGE